MSMVISGDNGLTFPAGSTQVQAGNYQTMVNRIINPRMEIDQRNAGASVTITGTNVGDYVLDRFYLRASSATGSKVSVQRSTVAPSGFINSQLVTSLSAYSIGASEHFAVNQAIEGFNIADLGWGTANAKTVTLSFWVRSSLTGTFGGSVVNNAGNRCFIFSYTISSANTWEYKTITITGDTTGTWLTDNGVGLYLSFSVAAGSSVTASAGSWSSTFSRSVTGQTSLVGTNGATFYITGVDLRVGSYTVVPQDFRAYGTELALCQRYYQTIYNLMACAAGTTQAQASCQFPVVMRAAPTIGQGGSGTGLKFTDGSSDFNPSSFSFTNQNTTANGFFGLFPNYSGMTSRSALSLASDGGRWVTLSIEL